MSFSAFARRSAQTPAPAGRVAPLSLAPKPAAPAPVLQRKAAGAFAPAEAPPIVHRVLGTPGQPLDPPTRSFFEQRFRHDFSRVRIHADDQASQSAAAVGARAYTVGSQIVFGQPSPGRTLLGHELAHVVQQRALPSHATRIPVHTDPAAEREADHTAARIDSGQQVGAVSSGPRSGAVIQRQEAPAEADLGYIEKGLIEAAAAPAVALGSTAHDMVKATLRGFYVELKTNGPAHAHEVWEQVKDAFRHPTEIGRFILHYWWGLIKGVFSPITGLFDLGKLIVKLGIMSTTIQATAWRRRAELASDLTTLVTGMEALGGRAKAALNTFLDNKIETIRKIAPWFSSLEAKAVSAAEDGGHRAGQALLAQTSKPLPELGETAGEMVGNVLINAVLIAFTDGIGNGISQIAAKLGELGEWLGKFGEAGAMIGKLVEGLGELLGTVGGWITRAETALAKMAETVLKPLSPLLEEFGSVMKSLRAFLRDLFGASEEAATTAGGELAGGAARSVEQPHAGAPGNSATVPHDPPAVHAPSAKPAPETSTSHAAHAPSDPQLHPPAPAPAKPTPRPSSAEDVSVANRNMTREQWKAQEGKRRWKKSVDAAFDGELADQAATAKVTGGAKSGYRTEGSRVPNEPPKRVDINPAPGSRDVALPRRAGESAADALARVRRVIGKRISDIPELESLWNDARGSVLSRRNLTSSNYPELYDATRDAFWRRVRSADGTAAREVLENAGLGFASGRPAPQLLDVSAADASNAEITVSLDHLEEKAIGNNWTKALDADNLQFEFASPNSYREAIQARHPELRP